MEREAFPGAAQSYRDMVYRVALNCLGSSADAEDAVQEVLLKLYMERKPFESPAHMKNWLLRVTLNHCRNILRSPWRRRCVPLEQLRETAQFQRPEQGELFQVVMSMPEKDRTVLYLFYYEDLSVREIARLLKVKESAVTTRLARARERLRSELTEVIPNG